MAHGQDVQKEIGRRIRVLRESSQRTVIRENKQRQHNKMTREDLAHATKLSPNYLGNLELGRQNPTLETLLSIADALDVSIVSLLQDIDATGEKQKVIAELGMYLDKYTTEEIEYVFQVVKIMLERRPK